MRKNREIKTYDLDPTSKDENRINDVETKLDEILRVINKWLTNFIYSK